ncbi:MAG: peptidoglycan/xylan/chitin deacetylase (PgdA/CDA1 family) [Glaciecola sp.]|jgi:peptidoglycan/xylan/chitin deacetylase (PgdA/CDA1 family)
MYWTKTPSFIIHLFKSFLWRKKDGKENCVYLTFDDGPSEGITEKLLVILKDKKVPATFFCLGSEITKNPIIYQSILNANHSIGYHGWNHINGWKSTTKEFMLNAENGSNLTPGNMFRPPYGKVPFRLTQKLAASFEVIMWDVMSGDFDAKLSAESCVNNVVNNVQSGSIIVFHDNIKSADKMLLIVPKIIDKLREMSYSFGRL